jgi:hypothetical protein
MKTGRPPQIPAMRNPERELRGRSAVLDSPESSLYKPRAPLRPLGGRGAQVAQLVEHCTENAGVGGSIPPLGTTTNAPNNIFN